MHIDICFPSSIDNADARRWQHAQTDPSDSPSQQQTGVRFTFSDLTPGELYNVDINAIGAAGPSNFSDVGTLRVI